MLTGVTCCTLTHIPVQLFPLLQAVARRVLRHTTCEMQLSSIPALLSSVQLYAASTHTSLPVTIVLSLTGDISSYHVIRRGFIAH